MSDAKLVDDIEPSHPDWLPPEAPLSMPPQVLCQRGPGPVGVLLRLIFGRQSA